MKTSALHKVICVLALLVIGWQWVLNWLFKEDGTGFKVPEIEPISYVTTVIIVLLYFISIIGFVTGYRYAALERKNARLFWTSLVCMLLSCLFSFPFAFEYVKDLIVPPKRNIFDGLNLFDTSENRKKLIQQENISMLILAVLQIASIITIFRLRRLFKTAAV